MGPQKNSFDLQPLQTKGAFNSLGQVSERVA